MGLPAGFETRLHTKHYHGLTVHLADRFDQICFKLYAAVDQGIRSKHFNDLIALQPTNSELLIAKNWTITHDVSEGFAEELESLLAILEASREVTKKEINKLLIELCWSLWTELGIAGVIRKHQHILIAPEELILLTAFIR